MTKRIVFGVLVFIAFWLCMLLLLLLLSQFIDPRSIVAM